jgi:periplasmic protein TonB
MTGPEEEETMPAAIDSSLLLAPRTSLDLAFGFDAGRTRGRVAFVVLALALHGGLALAVRGAPARVAEITSVLEVELPPAPAPEPELPSPPPPEPPDPAEPVARPSALPPPPQAARAGALMTAKESAPSATKDELVDFVTDPAGSSYGSGVVARGGTADHGERGATAAGVGSAPVPVASPPRDGLVPASSLSRRASLRERDACAGFYPSEADADSGAVTVTVIVRPDGAVTSAAVVSESPAGQGFGKAARACLGSKRFEPALDRSGTPVLAATTVKLRFVR